jgi:hypothetical protein
LEKKEKQLTPTYFAGKKPENYILRLSFTYLDI